MALLRLVLIANIRGHGVSGDLRGEFFNSCRVLSRPAQHIVIMAPGSGQKIRTGGQSSPLHGVTTVATGKTNDPQQARANQWVDIEQNPLEARTPQTPKPQCFGAPDAGTFRGFVDNESVSAVHGSGYDRDVSSAMGSLYLTESPLDGAAGQLLPPGVSTLSSLSQRSSHRSGHVTSGARGGDVYVKACYSADRDMWRVEIVFYYRFENITKRTEIAKWISTGTVREAMDLIRNIPVSVKSFMGKMCSRQNNTCTETPISPESKHGEGHSSYAPHVGCSSHVA
ncbi:hypothetical protein RRG08_025968 [Elysia crispata]|uniref:Uncharacterized protein n=1 Tax=Elysia crispata TaxID=231223 RepID=A0AAE0ZG10_9GAST|nr:hypothetical protein RRG08_025968 [Elysia crispata]